MFYKFDKQKLEYVKLKWLPISFKVLGIFVVLLFIFGMNSRFNSKNDYSEAEIMVIMAKHNEFTEDKFLDKLKSLNFKFPYIVYAQAKLETGNFKSKMFIENNNLFGMKEATQRINTAKGTQFEHAFYENWSESLYDYALYYSRYLSSIKTEREFYEFLSQNYAQDKSYVYKLKEIVENENLVEKFK